MAGIDTIIFSFLSFIASLIGIFLVFLIFRKLYEDKYRRPWVFIGFATVLLGLSMILEFLSSIFKNYISGQEIISTTIISFFLFVGILFLVYGVFLEFLILRFYKGRFVKTQFIPVIEGTLGGHINLNVKYGISYISHIKDKEFLLKQFSNSVKRGFQGFLITESSPKKIRKKYNIEKTPILWINESKNISEEDTIKKEVDKSSGSSSPFEINDIVSFIDEFLEQSKKPFILFEITSILKKNNEDIINDFINYLKHKISKYEGFIIFLINENLIESEENDKLKDLLKELEIY